MAWPSARPSSSTTTCSAVFGAPQTTGKPTGTDLVARKATTVVVAVYQLASGVRQRQFKESHDGATSSAPTTSPG